MEVLFFCAPKLAPCFFFKESRWGSALLSKANTLWPRTRLARAPARPRVACASRRDTECEFCENGVVLAWRPAQPPRDDQKIWYKTRAYTRTHTRTHTTRTRTHAHVYLFRVRRRAAARGREVLGRDSWREPFRRSVVIAPGVPDEDIRTPVLGLVAAQPA